MEALTMVLKKEVKSFYNETGMAIKAIELHWDSDYKEIEMVGVHGD